MEIQKLTPQNVNDFIALIRVFLLVFEMPDLEMPNKKYLNSLIANPDFLVFVVKINGQVIGGLTVYVLHRYYSEKPTAYVYDVGVSPEHQRKGAGKLLMRHLVAYCQQNGFEDAFVQAEADDLEALNFYKNTAYDHLLDATHFTYRTNK